MTEATNTSELLYHRLTRQYREALEDIRTQSKDAVRELFREFFQQNPQIKCITWTQYTPYFNDGSPCEFSVNDMEPCIGDKLPDMSWADLFEQGDFFGGYTEDEDEYLSIEALWDGADFAPIREAFKNLGRSVHDEIFRCAFGNHVRVFASPEGFQIVSHRHG